VRIFRQSRTASGKVGEKLLRRRAVQARRSRASRALALARGDEVASVLTVFLQVADSAGRPWGITVSAAAIPPLIALRNSGARPRPMTVTVSFQPVVLATFAEPPGVERFAAALRQASEEETAASSTEARLLFVDGKLGAVLVRIEDEFEEERHRGAWFLEAGFGVFAYDVNRIFASLSDAAAWAAGIASASFVDERRRQP